MATTMTSSSQPDLVELEIAAFMGPHIKRARIALVLVGALYAIGSYLQFDDIAKLRDLVRGDQGGFADAVNLAYYFVVATIVAGVTCVVCAAIGGANPTGAIYVATVVFGLHSMFALYVGGIILFISWTWWLSAIVLAIGFQAAYKAQQLRRQRQNQLLAGH